MRHNHVAMSTPCPNYAAESHNRIYLHVSSHPVMYQTSPSPSCHRGIEYHAYNKLYSYLYALGTPTFGAALGFLNGEIVGWSGKVSVILLLFKPNSNFHSLPEVHKYTFHPSCPKVSNSGSGVCFSTPTRAPTRAPRLGLGNGCVYV